MVIRFKCVAKKVGVSDNRMSAGFFLNSNFMEFKE
jgi:hypothetical protein